MKNEHGNVLFLILIAVALFAALSYAVTSSTRSGGGSASTEKLTTDIAAVMQQGVAIRTAVIRMMNSRGITADQLLFESPPVFASLTAGEIPREVYHPNGGGATYANGWIVTSGFEVTGVGLSDIGDPLKSSDIVAMKEVSREACLQINKKLGINIQEAFLDMVVDIDVQSEDDNIDRFRPGINGGYNGFYGAIGSTRDSTFAPFDTMAQGCFLNGFRNEYIYYDVIVAR